MLRLKLDVLKREVEVVNFVKFLVDGVAGKAEQILPRKYSNIVSTWLRTLRRGGVNRTRVLVNAMSEYVRSCLPVVLFVSFVYRCLSPLARSIFLCLSFAFLPPIPSL